MSQAAIARDCEVDQSSVMRWELGAPPRGRNIGAYYRTLASIEAAIGHTVPKRIAEPAQV